MKTRCHVLLAFLGMLALSLHAFGQTPAPDGLVSAAVETAQKQYNNSFVGNPQLFSGPEYVDYAQRYHTRNGHQFFLSPEKQAGSVYYNNQYFADLHLAYDVVLDQVVLSQPGSPLALRLVNERVRYFTVNNHHFVRLVADSSGGTVIHTGFFEMLLDGTVQVVAKRAKRLQEHIAQPYINAEFTSTDRLFIKKAGTYYPINKKSAALRLFSDHSKEMQDYLKQQKSAFRNAPLESIIVQLAGYYCTLPPASH